MATIIEYIFNTSTTTNAIGFEPEVYGNKPNQSSELNYQGSTRVHIKQLFESDEIYRSIYTLEIVGYYYS